MQKSNFNAPIKNPSSVRLSRPGYQKFRVEDLGINIIEKNPNEFTVMEDASVRRNGRASKVKFHKEVNNILIFHQNIGPVPYLCFSDGHTDLCLPQTFQATNSQLSRVIKDSFRISDVIKKISTGGCVENISQSDMSELRKSAERFGKIITKERDLNEIQISDYIFESDCVSFKYLIASLIEFNR